MKRSRLKQKTDPKLAAWSKAVRERDGGKCQWPERPVEKILSFDSPWQFGCVTRDRRIDPHHIAPKGRRPDLKYDVNNGICLCRTHHDWVHANPFEAEKLGLLSTESYELAMRTTK